MDGLYVRWHRFWLEHRALVTYYSIYLIKGGRGYYTLKICMFCVLSRNYQHFFLDNMCIFKQIVQGTLNGTEILVGDAVFKL